MKISVGRRSIFKVLLLVQSSLFFMYSPVIAAVEDAGPAERRRALLRADVGKAVEGLNDSCQAVRMTALRQIVDAGGGSGQRQAIVSALSHKDPNVRRCAFQALSILDLSTAEHVAMAIKDDDDDVRLTAVRLVVAKPIRDPMRDLLVSMDNDRNPIIRDLVNAATWPFSRHELLLSQKETDVMIKRILEIDLPSEGWKLAPDPAGQGHRMDWFFSGFDDSRWSTVSIGRPWGEQGRNYIGFAWYRRKIALPLVSDRGDAVELLFEGVDESAWIWINGQYAGFHDLGAEGWDRPFQLPVSDLIRWGEENQISIRVRNRAGAGGVYKRVALLVLRAGN